MLPDTILKMSCFIRCVTNKIVTLVDVLRTGNHGIDRDNESLFVFVILLQGVAP